MSKPLATYTLGDAVRVYLLWRFRKLLLIGAALIAWGMLKNAEDHPAPPRYQRICLDMNEAGWCRSFENRRVAAGLDFDHRFGDDQAWCVRFDIHDGHCLRMQTATDEALKPYKGPKQPDRSK